MPLKILSNKRLHIPFIDSFKHASACRNQSSSFWVEVHSDKHIGYGEGCPRPYVSDETLDSAEAFLLQKQADICAEINDLAALKIWVTEHRQTIDSNPAAWCAIELALLDLFAKGAGRGSFETVDFRDALGVSRKYAVPLLDYFDVSRLTVRSGSRRTPGAEAKKYLQI